MTDGVVLLLVLIAVLSISALVILIFVYRWVMELVEYTRSLEKKLGEKNDRPR